MIDLAQLVQAIASTLEAIPELMAQLAPTNPVDAYIDLTPTRQSVAKAIYQAQRGSLLVVWFETRFLEEEMTRFNHVVEIYGRALQGKSAMDLATAIMNGIPQPGNLFWRFCPVMDGVLPTNVTLIERVTDSEGVDYLKITTETLETGDYNVNAASSAAAASAAPGEER
jgi:hypothetical protein